MITKADIINIAKHALRRGNGLPDRKLMHPYREWYGGLIGLFVLVAVGATYSFIQFRAYTTLEERLEVNEPDTVEYRHDDAALYREQFDAREEVFERLRQEYATGAPPPPTGTSDSGPVESGAIELAP